MKQEKWIPYKDRKRRDRAWGTGRPRMVTKQQIARIKELTELGWSRPDIAKDLKLAKSTIYIYQNKEALI